MALEMWPVDRPIPYDKNPRTHSETQVAQLVRSIQEFGFTNPILVDRDGIIIAGHGRLLAAKKAGLCEVPVIVLGHLSDTQRRALVIADNKLALNAGWDDGLLAAELEALRADDFDMSLVGFSDDELSDLLDCGQEDGDGADPDEEDPGEPPADPKTKQGTLYVLDRHRLLCGDCRNPADVRRLLCGRKINLAVTSPPYASQREYDPSSGFKPIPPREYVGWYRAVADNIKEHLSPDGSYFCNIKAASDGLDTETYVLDLVLAHAREWGWHFATEFCWERVGIPGKPQRRFKNQFEPVYQFALGDWKFRPDAVRHKSEAAFSYEAGKGKSLVKNQGTVGEEWFAGRADEGMAYPGNRLPTFAGSHTALGHGAAYPVGLPEFFIKAYSDAGDIVFDPFMGSGTTLLAADKVSRIAYGTEISPAYCDMIVARWEKATGKTAEIERQEDAA